MVNKAFIEVHEDLKNDYAETKEKNTQCEAFLKFFEEMISIDCSSEVLFGALYYQYAFLNEKTIVDPLTGTEVESLNASCSKMKELIRRMLNRLNISEYFNYREKYYTTIFCDEIAKKYKYNVISWEAIQNQWLASSKPIAYIYNTLITKYTRKDNAQRMSFISLIDQACRLQMPVNLIIGLLYVEYEIARASSYYHSDMLDILDEILKTIHNPKYPEKMLNQFDPFIFTTKLYLFLSQPSLESPELQSKRVIFETFFSQQNLYWETYQAFVDDVLVRLSAIASREKDKVDIILSEPYPTTTILATLKQELDKFKEETLDKNEKDACYFLSVVLEHCLPKIESIYKRKHVGQFIDNNDKYDISTQLFSVRNCLLGALVFVLHQTGKNSEIHKFILENGHFEEENKISKGSISLWLKSLSTEMHAIKNIKKLNDDEYIGRVIKQLDDYIHTNECQRQTHTEYGAIKTTQWAFRNVFGMFTSVGISAGISCLTGPLGSFSYILGFVFYKFIFEKVLPTAVIEGANYAADKAGEKAGRMMLTNVVGLFSAKNNDTESFDVTKPCNWSKMPNFRAWLECYAGAPAQILSDVKKAELIKIFQANEEEKTLDASLVMNFSPI